MTGLIHPFKDYCFDRHELLDDCNNIGVYCRRVAQQSGRNPDRRDPNRYKGDGLEVLVEAYLKLHPVDNRIGITGYTPILEDDWGVDGFGTGNDGKPATVQIKYRPPNYVLTLNKDHLGNFGWWSVKEFGVDPNGIGNLLIITTAKCVHHKIVEFVFGQSAKVIAFRDLQKMLNGNNLFWNAFREAMFNVVAPPPPWGPGRERLPG